jgi:sigma-B regulation protein RsbU (phosphoserine phosphatase)
MPDDPASTMRDRSDADPVRISCAQVQGGNGAIFGPVELPGSRAVLFSRPSEGGRGGDVHYISVCGSGVISRFCLADVVGHGESVATVSDEIHRVLQRLMNWMDHRRVLGRLNRLLQRKGLDALTTAAVATYYPPRREFSFSYAGHPPGWYFTKKDGSWRRLELPPAEDDAAFINGSLAVTADARFTRERRRAEVGDRFLLLTDGILETPAADGEEYGAARVEALLNQSGDASLEDLAAALIGELERFSGDAELPHDDVTFLIVEFTKPVGLLSMIIRNRLLRPLGLARGD